MSSLLSSIWRMRMAFARSTCSVSSTSSKDWPTRNRRCSVAPHTHELRNEVVAEFIDEREGANHPKLNRSLKCGRGASEKGAKRAAHERNRRKARTRTHEVPLGKACLSDQRDPFSSAQRFTTPPGCRGRR